MENRMYYIGIDPDVRGSAVAVLDANLRPIMYSILPCPKDKQASITDIIKGQLLGLYPIFGTNSLKTRCLIESPEIYVGVGKTRNPTDILRLGQVSSALLVGLFYSGVEAELIQPKQWKGQVPKDIHANRIASKLGIKLIHKKTVWYPESLDTWPIHCHPSEKPTNANWPDIIDAFGLAFKAAEMATRG